MDLILMDFVEEAEEEDRREMLRLERRHLRDTTNVFELPEKEFRKRFRLNKALTRNLIEELTPHMQDGLRNTKVSITTRVMAALRFFAQGSYQRGIGNEMHVSMAQQTFSKALSEVCTAMEAIAPRWVKFPITQPEKENKKAEFMQHFQFPGTIGCIDCTHVAILRPSEDEHLYLNRKRYHSKIFQIICDTNLVILNVNANYGGASHDAFIWRNSAIKQHLEENYERGDRNSWLIGDSGYPQEPWLMTPIRGMPPDSPEGRYTAALNTARNCVERCIGVWKNRFRCVLRERVLRYHPFKCGQIINSCCVLHNMCIRANIPLEEEVEEDNEENVDGVNHGAPNILALGQQRRAEIIDLYFNI